VSDVRDVVAFDECEHELEIELFLPRRELLHLV